jgi:hypothetical protein
MRRFMKFFLLLLLFNLLIAKSMVAQPVFKNDTAFRPFSQQLVTTIDSNFHLKSNADFELRFWTLIAKTLERRLFILYLDNGKWTARLFRKTSFLKDTLVEITVKQDKLKKLRERLNEYKLLTIKNEAELRDKYGNEINDPVYDGISYCFELITGKNKRSYWYHCPKSSAENYPYIKEYKYIVKIITLIYQHCFLALNIC